MTHRVAMVSALAFFGVAGAFAQAPKGGGQAPRGEGVSNRPPLFFKEEWKQLPSGGEHAVTTEATANPNLELKLYGPSAKEMQLTGVAGNEGNPIHLWTGLCTETCAAALRDKNNYVDLSGLGRIRWVTKISGFHKVHPILKLADGTWLVGDRADGSPLDWQVSEFNLAEVKWLKLDIDKVVTKGNWIEKPDLTKVDEVGFTDLMPASGHGPGGWSDVGQIEVFGKPVKRDAAGK
jgi:hypothetical protein